MNAMPVTEIYMVHVDAWSSFAVTGCAMMGGSPEACDALGFGIDVKPGASNNLLPISGVLLNQVVQCD